MTGTLYLIPSPLGPASNTKLFPEYNLTIVQSLCHFIVENTRTTRRFLRSFGYQLPFDKVVFFELNKHTHEKEMAGFLAPLLNGNDMGIISEADRKSVV